MIPLRRPAAATPDADDTGVDDPDETLASTAASGARRVGVADLERLDTVRSVSATSPIHQREQYAALKRGLGRIADHAVAGTDTPQGPALRLVHAPAPSDDARFPVGAQTRKLDAAGRVKLRWDSASVAELLGWGPGLLDAVCHDGWLVLTQRDDLVNAKPGSNSSFASITNAGTANERIALRGAHLHHLGVADGDHLLLAPLPDAGALVLTNPCRLAAFASEQVLALIAGDDD